MKASPHWRPPRFASPGTEGRGRVRRRTARAQVPGPQATARLNHGERRVADLFQAAPSENKRYARQVRDSAGLAVFASGKNDKAHWVETGRCYERFALQATALGIRDAFLNQPVEMARIRAQLKSRLGLGDMRPDLLVRFGRGPRMPASLGRPVEAVLL